MIPLFNRPVFKPAYNLSPGCFYTYARGFLTQLKTAIFEIIRNGLKIRPDFYRTVPKYSGNH